MLKLLDVRHRHYRCRNFDSFILIENQIPEKKEHFCHLQKLIFTQTKLYLLGSLSECFGIPEQWND